MSTKIKDIKRIVILLAGALFILLVVVTYIFGIGTIRDAFNVAGIIISTLFGWWFLCGLLFGAIYLAIPSYEAVATKRDYSRFQAAKGPLLVVGSFFAIGGLIVKSFDKSVDIQSHVNKTQYSMIVENYSLADYADNWEYQAENCNPERILNRSISNAQFEPVNQISDSVVRCVYYKKYEIISKQILSVLSAPDALKTGDTNDLSDYASGVDNFVIQLNAKSDELLMLSNMQVNKNTDLPTVNGDLFKDDLLNYINNNLKLGEEIAVSNQIGAIRGMIFFGVGLDAIAILFSIVLWVVFHFRPTGEAARDEEIKNENGNTRIPGASLLVDD